MMPFSSGLLSSSLVLAVFVFSRCGLGGTFRVTSEQELTRTLLDVRAGDVVEISDGRYATSRIQRVNVSGTAESPVVVRACDPGKAVLAGCFGLTVEKSAHVVIDGLTFEHSNHSKAIEIKHSSHVVIRNCTFRLNEDVDQSTHWVYTTGRSSHVTIKDCLFEEKHKQGCFITLGGTEEDDDPPKQIVQHCRIENCTFRNVGPRVKNGMEAVRLGDSDVSMSDAFCVLTGCTFENCDGDPEVVSVKCCQALIDGNTFRDCHGTLCLRHGNHNRVTKNTFLCSDGKPGVGGIRIYGCDHEVTHNTLTNLTGKGDEAPLVLSNGETDTGPLNARFRPQRVRIAHNVLTGCVYSSLDIGYDNDGKLKLPSLDCVIEHNTIAGDSGTLVNIIHSSPTLVWRKNQLTARGTAETGIEVRDEQVIPVP